jgi:hypothetical protein
VSEVTFSGKCPQCGFSEKQIAKPVSSQINTYKNQKGELGVFNNHVDSFKAGGNVWTKQDPAPGTSPISLAPKTSAAVKAVSEATRETTSLEVAGNPVTGVAAGAEIKGAPAGATAPLGLEGLTSSRKG